MHEVKSTERALRELAHRDSDGLDVRLFWHKRDDVLYVSVVDTKTGDFFSVEAARDNALDVFYHPFSYAASHKAPHTNLLLAA